MWKFRGRKYCTVAQLKRFTRSSQNFEWLLNTKRIKKQMYFFLIQKISFRFTLVQFICFCFMPFWDFVLCACTGFIPIDSFAHWNTSNNFNALCVVQNFQIDLSSGLIWILSINFCVWWQWRDWTHHILASKNGRNMLIWSCRMCPNIFILFRPIAILWRTQVRDNKNVGTKTAVNCCMASKCIIIIWQWNVLQNVHSSYSLL